MNILMNILRWLYLKIFKPIEVIKHGTGDFTVGPIGSLINKGPVEIDEVGYILMKKKKRIKSKYGWVCSGCGVFLNSYDRQEVATFKRKHRERRGCKTVRTTRGTRVRPDLLDT